MAAPTTFHYGLKQLEKFTDRKKEIEAFVGDWVEIKGLCGPGDAILKESGVAWVKRVAMKAATLQHDIRLEGTSEGGAPQIYMKVHYPLNITKDTKYTADGREFEQDDSADTCVWKTRATFEDGCLMQRRQGAKGEMWDVRCVVDKHPDGKSDVSPIMYFLWVLVDLKGNTHTAEHWLRKK